MEKLLNDIQAMVAEAKFNLRLGQALFNALPDWATSVVAGSTWDPFHRDFTMFQITNWINEHLIFKDGEVVAVYNRDVILAERPE